MVKKKSNNKKSDIDLDIADIIMNDISDEYRYRVITRKYKKIFQDRNKMNDDDIINNYSDFVYKTISEKFDSKSIPERAEMIKFREFCTNKAWRLKQRWCKSAIESLDKKSNKLLNKEYLKACEDYSKYEKVLSLNVDTPEDLIEERKKFLTKWASSSEYNICDYPYLTELTDKKIEAAFSQDIMLCVTEYLKKQYEYDINKMVVKTPAGVSPGLFIPNKRGRKPDTLAVTKKGENFASKMYCDIEDEDGVEVDTFYEFSMENARQFKSSTGQFESLKLELVNPETEEKALEKALKKLYLDEQDLEIMRFVYTYSYKTVIPFYISDLLKHLQLSDSKDNYRRIEDKLIKLPYYTFYTEKYDEITNSKKRSSFNLFSRVDIETDPKTNRRAAKVIKSYVTEVEIVSTELMYKRELNKLKLEQSRNLAYFLEGRRSFEISSGVNVKNKKYTYSIDYLKWYVHLDNKKSLKKNMLYLEEGLKEIMENHFIIKKYQMNQSSFDVWFYEGFEKRKALLYDVILSLEEPNGNIIEV